MKNELKPCPFCGGEVQLFKDDWDKYGAHCKECQATVGVHLGEGWRAMLANRKEAVTAWNRRANLDSCENELIVRCENRQIIEPVKATR